MKPTAILVALLLSLAPVAGRTTPAEPSLEEARSSYEQLRYDDAAATLAALLQGGALPREQRVAALKLKGVVEVIRGEDELAREHFRELLRLDPDAALTDGLSPKITRVFDEVKASVSPPPPAETPSAAPAPSTSASPAAADDARSGPAPASREEGDDVSGLALGVAAGAAVAAALLVGGAGALLLLSGQTPPESSLGTVQLP